MTSALRRMLALLALVAGGGCAPPHGAADWATVREITPAFLDTLAAADPAIAADAHGRVALTWVTRDTSGAANLWLTISRDSGATFGTPLRVNVLPGSVASFFESRPVPVFGPSGAMLVAWADRRPLTPHAVDVAVRASSDGGVTLGATAYVNDDRASGTVVYHGFPALMFRPDASVFAAWLDERNNLPTGEEPGSSALYAATSTDGGQTWSTNHKLRDSVCSCCRPAVAGDTHGGIAVGFRDARRDLRDPALLVSLDGGTTFVTDTVIHADHWLLPGCPDVGPAITWNHEGGGAYAWFTGAEPAGVYLLTWRPDGGAAGVPRALTDSVAHATHPRLAAMGEATLIGVEALPAADTTRTVFAVRQLDAAGTLTPWLYLGANTAEPWLTSGDTRNAYACWLEQEGTRRRVRVVRLVRR